MSDELLRQLERAAASGDPEAEAKYVIVRRRHGKEPPLLIILNNFSQLEIRMAEIMKDMVWREPPLPDISKQMEILSKSMTEAAENFKVLGSVIPKDEARVTFKGGTSVTYDEYRKQCKRSQAPFRRPKKRMKRPRSRR